MFRQEVVEKSRRQSLAGNVWVAVPLSWQAIGFLVFCCVVSAILFLSLSSYPRTEIAAGTIVPESGVVLVTATRSGVISSLAVTDGQNILKGQQLAAVRTEEDGVGNAPPTALVESAIARQDASLSAQVDAALAMTAAHSSQLVAESVGLSEEIRQVQSQLLTQRALVASAERDLAQARIVAERGFVSGRDLMQREERLLSSRQGLSQLDQALAVKQAALLKNEKAKAQIIAQGRVQTASLAAMRAEVAQRAANVAGSRGYILRAPVDGRVTALTSRVGQSINAESQLMVIVPASSKLQAEVAVPSSSIGFVKEGQQVRMEVHSFPYQRFGVITGIIKTISSTSVKVDDGKGGVTLAYPATVTLNTSSINAYGNQEPLVSGMTLTAKIIVERQTLLAWLFDPLFAVRRR